jgi:hypothetical protein
MRRFLKTVSFTCFDNDFDTDSRAWVPEVWAAETLAILEENLVIGRLVHTDFKDEVKEFGDTVNTRKPGAFTAERKGVNDDVTVQDATAEKVAVVLDQYFHTSFLIRDGQESLSFEDLVEEYLAPAASSLATAIDKVLLAQAYQFMSNGVGDLGRYSESSPGAAGNVKGEILNTRQKMNENNAPVSGRNMILAPDSETEALKLDLFISADKIGDEGTAMREASLGRKLGFDFYMAQNVSSVGPVGSGDYAFHADELASDAAAGATTVTLDAAVIDNGQYITLENDEQPLRIISGGGTTTPVFNRPLRVAVPAATSNLVEYVPGDVDLTGHTGVTAYPAGYAKKIRVDGTGDPHVGQLVSFSNGATMGTGEYAIIRVEVVTANTTWLITLDRPLESALSDGDKVNYGPIGDYNFAFTRGALALVTRPLAPPKPGTGALSGVAVYNDLAIRVTITYNGTQQGHLVTLDVLAGVKVLDTDQGAVMYGGSSVLTA